MTANLFPKGVVVVTAPTGSEIESLTAEEEACIRRAVPRRRREFAAGRSCARKALACLGIHDYSLIAESDRVPVWPEGIAGSITHTKGVVGAAVVRRGQILGVGFDIEVASPLNTGLVRRICRHNELRWIRVTPPPYPTDWPKILFSAKEAVYKCVWPLTGAALDFQDVDISVAQAETRFFAHLPHEVSSRLPACQPLVGSFLVSSSHVFTAVSLVSSQTK